MGPCRTPQAQDSSWALDWAGTQRLFSGFFLIDSFQNFSLSIHNFCLSANTALTVCSFHISSVQLLSRVWLFATPWTAAHQASLSITISHSLLKFMSIESVMPSNLLILRRPLLLPPSIIPSIRVFSNESSLHIRWPKHWSFSISPSSEYSGSISSRINCLISLLSKELSGVFSSTTIQKHQFFSAQPSLWANSHICTWLLEKP